MLLKEKCDDEEENHVISGITVLGWEPVRRIHLRSDLVAVGSPTLAPSPAERTLRCCRTEAHRTVSICSRQKYQDVWIFASGPIALWINVTGFSLAELNDIQCSLLVIQGTQLK